MFGMGPATRIYLAAGVTDMRKGFEGLHGLVRDRLSCEPLELPANLPRVERILPYFSIRINRRRSGDPDVCLISSSNDALARVHSPPAWLFH